MCTRKIKTRNETVLATLDMGQARRSPPLFLFRTWIAACFTLIELRLAPDFVPGLPTCCCSLSQACNARDGLAKAMYSRLFDWLTERINHGIEQARGRRRACPLPRPPRSVAVTPPTRRTSHPTSSVTPAAPPPHAYPMLSRQASRAATWCAPAPPSTAPS